MTRPRLIDSLRDQCSPTGKPLPGKAPLIRKNLSLLHTVSRFLAVTLLCIVSGCAVSCASQSSYYSQEGMAFVAGTGYGWNLGNTFDALLNGNVRRAQGMGTVRCRSFPTAAKILDIGCGLEREAFALSDLKYDVAGIKISTK